MSIAGSIIDHDAYGDVASDSGFDRRSPDQPLDGLESSRADPRNRGNPEKGEGGRRIDGHLAYDPGLAQQILKEIIDNAHKQSARTTADVTLEYKELSENPAPSPEIVGRIQECAFILRLLWFEILLKYYEAYRNKGDLNGASPLQIGSRYEAYRESAPTLQELDDRLSQDPMLSSLWARTQDILCAVMDAVDTQLRKTA